VAWCAAAVQQAVAAPCVAGLFLHAPSPPPSDAASSVAAPTPAQFRYSPLARHFPRDGTAPPTTAAALPLCRSSRFFTRRCAPTPMALLPFRRRQPYSLRRPAFLRRRGGSVTPRSFTAAAAAAFRCCQQDVAAERKMLFASILRRRAGSAFAPYFADFQRHAAAEVSR